MSIIDIEKIRNAASERSIYFESDTYSDFMAGAELAIEEYEEKLRWTPVEKLPKEQCVIILEFSVCGCSNNYVIYVFDPECFEGKFHVNGVAKRWRKLIL